MEKLDRDKLKEYFAVARSIDEWPSTILCFDERQNLIGFVDCSFSEEEDKYQKVGSALGVVYSGTDPDEVAEVWVTMDTRQVVLDPEDDRDPMEVLAAGKAIGDYIEALAIFEMKAGTRPVFHSLQYQLDDQGQVVWGEEEEHAELAGAMAAVVEVCWQKREAEAVVDVTGAHIPLGLGLALLSELGYDVGPR